MSDWSSDGVSSGLGRHSSRLREVCRAMPLFVIQCTDRPGSLQLRLDTRPAHLDYMNGLGDRLVVGGPFLGLAGQPNGSMIVADFADPAAADAFADGAPYNKLGLFRDRKKVRT